MGPNPRLLAAMQAFIEGRCRKVGECLEAAPSRAPYDPCEELAARVRALGLERNLVELRDAGFTVLRGLAPALAEDVRAALLASSDPEDDLLGQNPVWARVVTVPAVLTLAEAAVGRGALLSILRGSIRGCGHAGAFLHCDQNWWPAPFAPHTQLVTFCWITDDSHASILGGPIGVVPRSHLHRRHPTRAEAEAEEGLQPLRAESGSVAVWCGETWHAEYPRLIRGDQVAAFVSYTRMCCRPQDNFSRYADEAWLRGQPEALRGLLGLEDMLGKSRRSMAALRRRTLQLSRV